MQKCNDHLALLQYTNNLSSYERLHYVGAHVHTVIATTHLSPLQWSSIGVSAIRGDFVVHHVGMKCATWLVIMRDITKTAKAIVTETKFELGTVLGTSGVLTVLTGSAVLGLLRRHAAGDWGDMSEDDVQANNEALADGDGRLFSSYERDGHKIWIITEADRACTTVLLPEEH